MSCGLLNVRALVGVRRVELDEDLEPGERADFTVRLDPAEEQKPGDAYAFDVITADAVTGQPFGAARVYALVS
jgi:hypothetical protein